MGGVPRKLRHFSRSRALDSKIGAPPWPASETRKGSREGGEGYGREDVCLAAPDKIASLLIKLCSWTSLLNSVVNTASGHHSVPCRILRVPTRPLNTSNSTNRLEWNTRKMHLAISNSRRPRESKECANISTRIRIYTDGRKK